MERRLLGKTGEQVSILGLGGFHLLEIDQPTTRAILNRYLDAGGNYVETSASYGNGRSEEKIGQALAHRRNEYLLASKVDEREAKGARRTLERSLRNLRTDRLDIWFMHAVQELDDLERLLAPGGALEAAERAREEGLVRFIGISGHGHPLALVPALDRYDFEVLFTQSNFYDRFNFPATHDRLIPLARERQLGIITFKALGDGYLWNSPGIAMRYAWSQPVSMVVAGINTLELLEQDLSFAESFFAMTSEDIAYVHENSPEYRDYVCRQCGHCPAEEHNLPLRRIFELEGWYDRQMWDGEVTNPEDYSLRVRLGTWYGQVGLARRSYAEEGLLIEPDRDYTHLNARCPMGLDIDRKLKIAHEKLSSDWVLA